MAGQYTIDVGRNVQANGWSLGAFTSNLSSPQTYLTRAAQGAVLSVTGGFAAEIVGPSLVAQSAVVGVRQGV